MPPEFPNRPEGGTAKHDASNHREMVRWPGAKSVRTTAAGRDSYHCQGQDLMPLINGMSAKATHNLHVPLPRPLHQRLRAEAARSGKPATTLARHAIEAWIEERERQAVHEAIAEYATTLAGSPADLDEKLERAAVEHLVPRRLEAHRTHG